MSSFRRLYRPLSHSQGEYPDEIIIDILCRLPVKDLLPCRRVCWRWDSIIRSPYFNNVYVNRGGAAPTILFRGDEEIINTNRRKMKLFFVDEVEKNIPTRSLYHDPSRFVPRLVFSYHGLALFVEQKNYYIFNPVTGEVGAFYLPFGHIKALFYDPAAREYYAIWFNPFMEFKVVRLVSLLKSPKDPQILEREGVWEKFCDIPHEGPRYDTLAPTWTNDAIYWMADKYPCTNNCACAATCRPLAPSNCDRCIFMFDIRGIFVI